MSKRRTIYLSALLLLTTTTVLLAQSGRVALFPLTVAGNVDSHEVAEVQRSARAALADFGLSPLSQDEMQAKLQQKIAPITELCEEGDNACYATLADRMQVAYMVFGYAERVDQRLAIDLRLYERRIGKAANNTGGVSKQHLEYYVSGKSSIVDLTRRVVGKIVSRGGYLQVSTNVEGAEIIINNDRAGVYPLAQPLLLAKGKYKIVLRHAGYAEYSGEAEIKVEETTTFKGALKPLPFILTIESTPKNASIYLGEQNIGYTPLKNYQVTNFAKVPLSLKLNQYFEHQVELNVVPGGNYKENVTLKPQFGDLLIFSEALHSRVLIDGKFVGNVPLQLLERLPMGEHKVEIQNNNYEPFVQTITVVPGQRSRYDLNPKPRYGRLSVVTNAERARVYLNEKFVGYAPIDDFVLLPAGKYRARVSKPNYFDYVGELTLQPGKTTTLAAEMKTQLATMVLKSNLTGAKVYLDERYLGETPLKEINDIPMGEHQLLLTKPNYFDYSKKVNIRPDRINNIFAELITTFGKLRVDTNVNGVQIFLGDKFLGTTPAGVFEGLQPGETTLKLAREGVEPYIEPIVIKSNDLVVRTIDLKTLSAYAVITSTPTAATVYVNGKASGSTPISLPLKPKNYEIKVRSPGYLDYTNKVALVIGKPVRLNAVLTPKPFTLNIDTGKEKANVSLNGVFIGTTPLKGYQGSSFGPQRLQITKAGFKTIEKTIKLSPGTKTTVKIKLNPQGVLNNPKR